MIKTIIVARHHGFCMGVKRAIKIAEETSAGATDKVTILNEIVHNEAVVERFRDEGVGQASSVKDIDEGTLIISAHGVAPEVMETAEAKGLNVIDATCPLVANIYDIIERIVGKGFSVIHYGDPSHDETLGVVGQAPDRITVVTHADELKNLPSWHDRKLGLTIQTTADMKTAEQFKTLSIEKWPHIEVYDTICNATSQRQSAILELAPQVDLVLVVGSQSSANSKRLTHISQAACGRAELINSAKDIQKSWFDDGTAIEKIGLTAGASTPQFLVEAVIDRLMDISSGRASVVHQEKKRRTRRAGA